MERSQCTDTVKPISIEESRFVAGGSTSGNYGTATTTTSSLSERSNRSSPTRVRVHYFRRQPYLRGYAGPIIPPRPR